MTDLPLRADLTSGLTTEAEFQGAIGDLYDFVSQLVDGAAPESIEIASGVITPAASPFLIVDTEADAASDDLDRVVNTNIGAKTIILKCESSARPVTLRHNQSGTGKLRLTNGTTAVLDNTAKMITFYYDTPNNQWIELDRNWGVLLTGAADITAIKAAIGLGTASAKDIGTSAGQVSTNSMLGDLAFLDYINDPAQIANGTIISDNIANATIDFAKMKNQTADTVLGYNSSGVASLIPKNDIGNLIPVGTRASFMRSTAPAGWIKGNGGTIGNATSGATTRANTDTQALYVLFWTEFSNTILPIQDNTGAAAARGSTALLDFAAGKRLPVFDFRGEFDRGWMDNRTDSLPIAQGLAYEVGRLIGTHELDAIQQHNHEIESGSGSGAAHTGFARQNVNGNGGYTTMLGSTQTEFPQGKAINFETRVRNICSLHCIKL